MRQVSDCTEGEVHFKVMFATFALLISSALWINKASGQSITIMTENVSATFNAQIEGFLDGTYYDDGGYGLSPLFCQAYFQASYGSNCALGTTLPTTVTVTGTIVYTVTPQRPSTNPPLIETVTSDFTASTNSAFGSVSCHSQYSFETSPNPSGGYFLPAVGSISGSCPNPGKLFGGAGFNASGNTFVPAQGTTGKVPLTFGAISLNQVPPTVYPTPPGWPIPTWLTGTLTSGSVSYNTGNTTPPPTVQQLVALGNDAWELNPAGFGEYVPLDNLAAVKSPDDATQVTAYINGDKNNGGQIVIAAAGNKNGPKLAGFSKPNLVADESFIKDSPTDALSLGVENEASVVQQLASKYPTASITLTGISEGGAISQIVGNFANLQTVVFIAPGSGKLLASFMGDQILTALGAMGIPTPAKQTMNYRSYGDQLSLIGQPMGTQITVVPAILKQAVDTAVSPTNLLLDPRNWNTLFNFLHCGTCMYEYLGPNAPKTPGVLGLWSGVGHKWEFDPLFGLLLIGPQAADSFTETTDAGPDFASSITSILAQIVQPFDNIIAAGTAIELFHQVSNGNFYPLLIDPPAGYLYSLSASAGSPKLSSVILPTADLVGGDDVGWYLTYRSENGISGTQTSYTGEFDLPPGVDDIDFYAIDASGNAIRYNDTLLFTATLASAGQFNATLTTYLTPTTNLPLTSGQSCNGTFNGSFSGSVTVTAGQNCTFVNDCEITGDVTVVGGNLLLACAIDGKLTEVGGSIHLVPSARVGGGVQISQASTFALDPGAASGGNLQIQSLSPGLPLGTVCGAQVNGNMQVQNNASPVEIGGTTQQGCTGNSVGGNLLVDSNTAAVWVDYNTVAGALHVDNDSGTTDVSGNSVGKDLQCQNDNTVTYTALNMMRGKNQGQCSALP
jgi:hypothetical protein